MNFTDRPVEHHIAALPTTRPATSPVDPPTELGELRATAPLVRMTFPDGHEGWLATGYSIVRTILSDSRFSTRYEIGHYPMADAGAMPPAEPGDMQGVDAPEHTRYRKLLAGRFTVRRMRQLEDRIIEITARQLEVMAAAGGPLDLVPHFAHPVPALVICELLGVPYADRDLFRRNMSALGGVEDSMQQRVTAFRTIVAYISELVAVKRRSPTDDILSELTTSDLTDAELAGIGALLLGAGLDTTANMVALGTLTLLQHPEQLATVRDDPEAVDRAVEELMRYLTIAHTNLRTAVQDVEIAGTRIAAYESVALAMQAANRDPAKFADPDVLDIARDATGHIGFGHGRHQCLGQQLARMEMRIALPALLRRFPTLRLAAPVAEIPMRAGLDIYGVHSLPVDW